MNESGYTPDGRFVWAVTEVRCPECGERMPPDEALDHWKALHQGASA